MDVASDWPGFTNVKAEHRLDSLFDVIPALTKWHDDHAPRTREEQGLRVAKAAQEAGEALAAWFGWVGNNPRKGHSHDLNQVLDELADTAMAALIAIDSLGVNPETAMRLCAAKCLSRLGPAIGP